MSPTSKRMRMDSLSVDGTTEGVIGGGTKSLASVVDDVLQLLYRYGHFDCKWFENAVQSDCTEWQWAILNTLRSNGSAQAKRSHLVPVNGWLPTIKSEYTETDFFAATDCCVSCRSVIQHNAPAHSDTTEKMLQRADIHHQIDLALMSASKGTSGVTLNTFILTPCGCG